MKRTSAKSPLAARANQLVESLQRRFVEKLEAVGRRFGGGGFEPQAWLRDEGRHGGGIRYYPADETVFNRASVNVSQVHYDDDAAKRLGSATALSTIIHPDNPYAPSLHMHISWTEMKDRTGYWRMMADLNPAIDNEEAKDKFEAVLRRAAPQQYAQASKQGDRYFYIPALGRCRGVSHFYLEGYRSGDDEADFALARSVGESVIDCYGELLLGIAPLHPRPSAADYGRQLAYHTLYLFQVLTLDRGTTTGLLVHDQNDAGILASLPARIDRKLLSSWRRAMQPPQDRLLDAILAELPDASPCPVEEGVKLALANALRRHYAAHPEALALQAGADIVPTTVENHRPRPA
ncbi:MAG: coproporphyrinogen III oxidase [Gammaproteobacteria bacterium]